MTSEKVLTVDNLSVVYDVEPPVKAVKNVSFELYKGEIFGLAGESGCGKSTLAYAIQRLLQEPAMITSGSVIFHDGDNKDIDINKLSVKQMRAFRWDKISMVFQGAMNALNPVMKIGEQLTDVFGAHRPDVKKDDAAEQCKDLLDIVGVGADRFNSYPHELSGGMRQRVMIAMALTLRPRLMIMDEPTTALDVLVQREILNEVLELRKQFGFSVIFITHDLPLLLEISDKLAIMRQGSIIELDKAENIFNHPKQDYTKKLLSSFPRLTGDRADFTYGTEGLDNSTSSHGVGGEVSDE